MTMRWDIDGITHLLIAGVPKRDEPDAGGLNYSYLSKLTNELGYGRGGCKYRPKSDTSNRLKWMKFWFE